MSEVAVLVQQLKRARRTMPPHPRRIAINLIEQIGELDGYVRPAWATHPRQTLPVMIVEQIALLEHAMQVSGTRGRS